MEREPVDEVHTESLGVKIVRSKMERDLSEEKVNENENENEIDALNGSETMAQFREKGLERRRGFEGQTFVL